LTFLSSVFSWFSGQEKRGGHKNYSGVGKSILATPWIRGQILKIKPFAFCAFHALSLLIVALDNAEEFLEVRYLGMAFSE
jgi:hypothetical protein